MKRVTAQGGQALVLVLLSLAVVLTLVLFVLSRSVTDVAVSSREEEAVRAFSAAEAGIEKALVVGTGLGGILNFAESTSAFTYPINLTSGEMATLWFVDHDVDGNIVCGGNKCFRGSQVKICWGKPGTATNTATTPAVELSVFYAATPGDYSTLRIARGVFDPNAGRRVLNAFAAPDGGTCTINGENFEFQKTVNLATLSTPIPPGSYNAENGLQLAHLRIFYNTDTTHKGGFDVSGGSLLPSQGLIVDSSGEAGQSTRRLSVFQGWPEAPSVFEYSVYSSTGLTK